MTYIVHRMELSKQSYWESVYDNDMRVMNDTGDVGEIWFGEHVHDIMVATAVRYNRHNGRCIDLGCGNGAISEALRHENIECDGVDFSPSAIALARKAFPNGHYFVQDLLEWQVIRTYDIVLDKGTLDAIYLSDNEADVDCYLRTVTRLLSNNGHFIITSCNLTETELIDMVPLNHCETYPHPKIEFMGHSGSKVTTCVFSHIDMNINKA